MDRTALITVSIVCIADSFKPNVSVETRSVLTVKGQIPITTVPDIMQHNATFFCGGTNTPASLCVYSHGLLTPSYIGDEQRNNQGE